MSTIALTCPSSFTSWILARCLLRRGHDVRLLGHPSQRLEQLIELGADIIDGNLLAADRIGALLEGATAAYVVTPGSGLSGDRTEVEIARTLASVIATSEVQHLIVLSSLGAGQPADIEHLEIKAEVEQILLDTGRDVTILRPGVFMDNLWFARRALDRGFLALPMEPDTAFPAIAARDVALTALCAITRGPAGCYRHDMPGPAMVTPNLVAEQLGQRWGRPISYKRQRQDEFRAHLETLGMSERRARLVAQMLVDHETREIPCDPPAWVRRCGEMGLEPTSFASFTRELADPMAMPPPVRQAVTRAEGRQFATIAPEGRTTPAAWIPGDDAW